MRVLHVQKVKGIGGSERHLLSLLPRLAEAGVEVRMCVAATGRARDFTDRLSELGVAHSVIRAGPHANPFLVIALRREIRAFRPSLVHTHLIHADLHGQMAARLAGVPGISTVHGTHGFYEREPFRAAARAAGHSPRLTIAISEHVRRFLERLRISSPGSVRTVPYGIEASRWLAADAERDAARAALGFDTSEVVVGVASRLIPHKGHAMLLEAHKRASVQVPGLRLAIAGDGPLRAELQARARALDGTVRFLGFVSEIRELMCACDVFAFPSQPEFGEGFGLAALEAMATGRPVVATRASSLPEVVSHEETGILVDPTSIAELATALVRLAGNEDERREMGERGHERARTVFSLEAMVEHTLAVYDEIR